MPYTNNPAVSLSDRLRLEVGDTDPYEEGLSDEVYEYILEVNSNEVSSNSIVQTLKYLVAKYANYEHEEAGDLEIWGDKYSNYKQQLDSYLRDPRYGLYTPKPFAGGISLSDMNANRNNGDANLTEPSQEWFDVNNQNGLCQPYSWRTIRR